MSVSVTYDTLLSRVQVTATELWGASFASVERSLDQIRWTTVRGGGAVPVSGGALSLPVDEYEFTPNVTNYFRVRGIDSAPGPASFVAVGTGSTGAEGSRTPALPAGIVAGDVLVLFASTRNSGTGVPDTPAGWTVIGGFSSANRRLYGRVYDGSFVAPTVTYTGGAVNEDTLAQIAAFRRVKLSPVVESTLLNGSAQNITFAGLTPTESGMLVIYAGWKADDWSSVATIAPGFTVEISELVSTAGLDAGQVWDYYLPATTAPIVSGSFVVTGGVSAISRGLVVALEHADYKGDYTASITPTIGAVWLKSIARPFLNRAVDTRFVSSIAVSRKAQGGIFPIVGRSVPVAVSSIRGSREWTMYVRTETAADRDNTDLLLASGDILLVQSPPDTGVETGYVSVGDITRQAHPLRPLSNLWTLPMTEVAAPGPDVVGATVTWDMVVDGYADWMAVIADSATWAELLTLVGDPDEVIVP